VDIKKRGGKKIIKKSGRKTGHRLIVKHVEKKKMGRGVGTTADCYPEDPQVGKPLGKVKRTAKKEGLPEGNSRTEQGEREVEKGGVEEPNDRRFCVTHRGS